VLEYTLPSKAGQVSVKKSSLKAGLQRVDAGVGVHASVKSRTGQREKKAA